jgi:isochorismate hydrolase
MAHLMELTWKSTYDGKGAGIHTHICIAHTTYGAFIRGYTIIAEGVNVFTEEDHREGLEYIHNNYGAPIKKVSDIIKDL